MANILNLKQGVCMAGAMPDLGAAMCSRIERGPGAARVIFAVRTNLALLAKEGKSAHQVSDMNAVMLANEKAICNRAVFLQAEFSKMALEGGHVDG
jgi:hypothetical protein